MKSSIITKFAVLGITLAATVTAFADVKIKSRQTVSGQTMENTTMIKGKRQRTETMNGALVTVMQCDMQRDIKLNPATQTYQISLFDDGTVSVAPKAAGKNTTTTKGGVITMLVTNKDTGERKQMFGYQARHIITTMESSSSPDACSLTKSKMQIDGWYIDAEFALYCAQNRYANYQKPVSGGCQDKFDVKTVGAAKKGYPVWEKMTMYDDSGKESFSTINEVVELSKATLSADLFDIPAGYREVKDATELYAGFGTAGKMSANTQDNDSNDNEGMNQNIKKLSQTKSADSNVGEKKAGTIRIGMAGVKTGSVGEGLNADELASAIQNTLGERLKGLKIELISLDSEIASGLEAEAKKKQCDFVLYATVSHKKGGGLGMFGKALGSVVEQTGGGNWGNTAANVAGKVAATTIVSASKATGNVKAKDEITLDIKLQNNSTAILTKQYKAKAKSAGEDIISPVIEQAAQAIIETTAK